MNDVEFAERKGERREELERTELGRGYFHLVTSYLWLRLKLQICLRLTRSAFNHSGQLLCSLVNDDDLHTESSSNGKMKWNPYQFRCIGSIGLERLASSCILIPAI